MACTEPDADKWATLLGPDEELSDEWLRTDEIEEFIGALEHTAWLADGVGNDVARWKWLIISLHNALQGACVCALRGRDTAGITMLEKKSARRVWQWLNIGSRPEPGPKKPEERLAAMQVLYERVHHAEQLDAAERLPPHEQRSKDVKKLNCLRNKFIHFVPGGLSLHVVGMPRIVRHCCDAIEHLAVKHSTFWHHLDEPRSTRIKRALTNLCASINAWELAHATPRKTA